MIEAEYSHYKTNVLQLQCSIQ